jgi:hypothetical protein
MEKGRLNMEIASDSFIFYQDVRCEYDLFLEADPASLEYLLDRL